MSASLNVAKRRLRKQIHERLGALSSEHISEESRKACRQVLAHPSFQHATHVSIYISMAKELQTKELLDHAFSAGKSVYVPRCDGELMDMVRLQGHDDLASLSRNKWGIPEPAMDRDAVDPKIIEVVLVPGVAFDASGNRCGHGKGYYDRYLMRATNAFACAVCLDEQVVDAVPADDHDRKPNIVVSPSGIVFSR
ncbi:hypothetical protein IW140_005936 [Coemansia sp. RSA 1813]|nr:hypothetical protein EV178_005949 [Coemansia sp. RSA 1646]KAJ1768604.1 hypothetical protein LPJ74_004762 [Coemansia sp. RSA 1843]KAJ2086110.1 hypothetical protein IW138_005898 [Coemansia sp. RSA 986]KAJ2210881.1 hypothetical protein EV179_005933 [Coemansia sp. RSA 487]KAJ2563938.1 hypothetical protein IW140_005936 [Coemansia sp. RSA 1813]